MKPVVHSPRPEHSCEPDSTATFRARQYRAAALGIALLALVWRLAIAWAMPALARDGVGFCWNARALAEQGLAAIREPEFNQHPLYSLSIFGVATILRGGGPAQSPLLWQTAGQIVSLVCGLGVVLLCGALTRRVLREVNPAADHRRAELLAMALAALLPLNVWLSADVMSEQLFLCAYLGAACLLLDVPNPRVALAFGLLVGAAFLVRPEGAGLGAAAAAGLFMGFKWQELRRSALSGLLMAIGFLTLASPYWIVLGGLSPKAEKQTVEEFVPAAAAVVTRPPLLAALHYDRRGLIEAIPFAAYETIRGGRVVVPLLALGSLIAWRRRLLRMPLLVCTSAAAIHFSLMVMLLNRHGYLDPRHALVLVIWLIPPAANCLDGLMRLPTGRRFAAGALCIAALAPLAAYSLRVPHAGDEYIRDAARWIQTRPEVGRSAILVGGSSQRRIAFYSNISFRAWDENSGTADEKVASLVNHLGIWQPAARFFAIEADPAARPGHERFGNAELLERLFADSRMAGLDSVRLKFPIEGTAELRVFELRERR